MKKILKVVVVILISITLVSCGSRSKKSFGDMLNTALKQLGEAESISINARMDISSEDDVIVTNFKARNLQSELEAVMSLENEIEGKVQTAIEAFIVDGVMYIDNKMTGEKITQSSPYSTDTLKLSGIPTRVITSIFLVDSEEKMSDGVTGFKLSIDEKAVKNLLSLASGFSENEFDMPEDAFNRLQDCEIFISFSGDGNIKEISYEIETPEGKVRFKLEVLQIGGDLDFDLPTTDGFE